MRGKAERKYRETGKERITPAYAGKSFALSMIALGVWDHPRLCGEKVKSLVQQHSGTGSPPPMRGKDLFLESEFPRGRITPAYAGKSSLHALILLSLLGSPPPMRGKVLPCP